MDDTDCTSRLDEARSEWRRKELKNTQDYRDHLISQEVCFSMQVYHPHDQYWSSQWFLWGSNHRRKNWGVTAIGMLSSGIEKTKTTKRCPCKSSFCCNLTDWEGKQCYHFRERCLSLSDENDSTEYLVKTNFYCITLSYWSHPLQRS